VRAAPHGSTKAEPSAPASQPPASATSATPATGTRASTSAATISPARKRAAQTSLPGTDIAADGRTPASGAAPSSFAPAVVETAAIAVAKRGPKVPPLPNLHATPPDRHRTTTVAASADAAVPAPGKHPAAATKVRGRACTDVPTTKSSASATPSHLPALATSDITHSLRQGQMKAFSTPERSHPPPAVPLAVPTTIFSVATKLESASSVPDALIDVLSANATVSTAAPTLPALASAAGVSSHPMLSPSSNSPSPSLKTQPVAPAVVSRVVMPIAAAPAASAALSVGGAGLAVQPPLQELEVRQPSEHEPDPKPLPPDVPITDTPAVVSSSCPSAATPGPSEAAPAATGPITDCPFNTLPPAASLAASTQISSDTPDDAAASSAPAPGTSFAGRVAPPVASPQPMGGEPGTEPSVLDTNAALTATSSKSTQPLPSQCVPTEMGTSVLDACQASSPGGQAAPVSAPTASLPSLPAPSPGAVTEPVDQASQVHGTPRSTPESPQLGNAVRAGDMSTDAPVPASAELPVPVGTQALTPVLNALKPPTEAQADSLPTSAVVRASPPDTSPPADAASVPAMASTEGPTTTLASVPIVAAAAAASSELPSAVAATSMATTNSSGGSVVPPGSVASGELLTPTGGQRPGLIEWDEGASPDASGTPPSPEAAAAPTDASRATDATALPVNASIATGGAPASGEAAPLPGPAADAALAPSPSHANGAASAAVRAAALPLVASSDDVQPAGSVNDTRTITNLADAPAFAAAMTPPTTPGEAGHAQEAQARPTSPAVGAVAAAHQLLRQSPPLPAAALATVTSMGAASPSDSLAESSGAEALQYSQKGAALVPSSKETPSAAVSADATTSRTASPTAPAPPEPLPLLATLLTAAPTTGATAPPPFPEEATNARAVASGAAEQKVVREGTEAEGTGYISPALANSSAVPTFAHATGITSGGGVSAAGSGSAVGEASNEGEEVQSEAERAVREGAGDRAVEGEGSSEAVGERAEEAEGEGAGEGEGECHGAEEEEEEEQAKRAVGGSPEAGGGTEATQAQSTGPATQPATPPPSPSPLPGTSAANAPFTDLPTPVVPTAAGVATPAPAPILDAQQLAAATATLRQLAALRERGALQAGQERQLAMLQLELSRQQQYYQAHQEHLRNVAAEMQVGARYDWMRWRRRVRAPPEGWR